MNRRRLETLLNQLREDQLSVSEVIQKLENLPYEDLEFAKIDHHRSLRRGFPEVILCEGKTVAQVVDIMTRLTESQPVLATRANPEMARAVAARFPDAAFNEVARTITLTRDASVPPKPGILVCCAGTSDIPVAEEAAVTAGIMGHRAERIFDIGVAGLHRMLTHRDRLVNANVVVVVAGMDGALPTVVSGLIDKPVIAVPTSVGYGAAFQGIAPLLTMLNACSPGVVVVNIDNGFGAGYFAAMINELAAANVKKRADS